MRTPGNDIELSVGFLFSEGIISSFEQIEKIDYFKENNVIKLKLTKGTNIDIDNLSRNILTYSSCGICGASIIDLIYKRVNRYPKGDFKVDKDIILSLPSMLKQSQAIFSKTGGIHASTLFDSKGNLIELREDVGRHNAMDKLLGRMLMDKKIPLDNTMVLFSGRSSFELVQKSILAGIPFIVSIGAPSSLAVELAEAYNVTLIGFLRENKFNVYSGIERVDLK
jgi:formate dehydrogenase family accessory protein FdhD